MRLIYTLASMVSTCLAHEAQHWFLVGEEAHVEQRGCVSMQLGFDFLEHTAKTMFYQYVERYNQEKDPWVSSHLKADFTHHSYEG